VWIAHLWDEFSFIPSCLLITLFSSHDVAKQVEPLVSSMGPAPMSEQQAAGDVDFGRCWTILNSSL
jgi:hypothetical protein